MPLPLVSHVGIAVVDLDAAVETYRRLLACDSVHVTEIPDQKVRVAMFDRSGSDPVAGGRIELLQATSPDSPISRFIARRGEGLHHICLYVDDIETRLAEMQAAGMKLIDETPRVGADGHRIAFVHPSGANGVLIELEER